MGKIEKLSLNLSNKLGDKLDKNKEEKAVLNYGLFIVIHTCMGIGSTFLVGILTDMLLEMLIISSITAMLKRYSGGVHASTPERCIIIGLTVTFLLAITTKYIENNMNTKLLILIILVAIISVYYILYKKCPVGSQNKPLTKESTRKKLRKKAFNLVNILSLIILICLIQNVVTIDCINNIVVSITLGLSLQSFILTKLGEKFIKKLDYILMVVKV